MKLSEINAVFPDQVRVIRDGSFEKTFLVGKGQRRDVPVISFLGNIKFLEGFLKESPECVICTEDLSEVLSESYSGGIAVSKSPKTTFFKLHNHFNSIQPDTGVSIADNAVIHPTAIIGAHNIRIGNNVQIDAYAVINDNVEIGDNCHIYEHVVIGTPGFYYYMDQGQRMLVKPAGKVILKENVAVHPNSSIENGVVVGDTIIGRNTIIDNICVIGHDSVVGENCTIAGGSVLAGGVIFGDNISSGIGVKVAPSVHVGSGATLSSGAVLTKDVPDNTHVSGNFAIEHAKYLKHIKEISKD